MKTAREILSELQAISLTGDTPEDGVLKALQVIGYAHDAIWQASADAALSHHLRGADRTARGYYEAVMAAKRWTL